MINPENRARIMDKASKYGMSSSLYNALIMAHSVSDEMKRFKCEECSKHWVTDSLGKLNAHIRKVHRKAFVCRVGVCQRAFGSKYDLSQHEKTHYRRQNY